MGPQFFLEQEEPGYPVSRPFSKGLASRGRVLIIADWNEGRRLRSCFGGFLLVLSSCVLYLRESASRRVAWTAYAVE